MPKYKARVNIQFDIIFNDDENLEGAWDNTELSVIEDLLEIKDCESVDYVEVLKMVELK